MAEAELVDNDPLEIASWWWSVMTWSDPGVCLYAYGSTGCVQSEEHREQCLTYIKGCIADEAKRDDREDDEREQNYHDLGDLAEYIRAAPIEEVLQQEEEL